jgi:segregation and condensation protein A
VQSFSVKTDVFEGPLELLLSLIEKRKLLINDISLATVADDFISYIETHPEFPMAETAHFILIGSTLLLIKSKSLLPSLMLTDEEEADIEDLEHRLVLYKKYKELSVHITERFGKQPLFFKTPAKIREPFFSPDSSMTIENLKEAIVSVLARIPDTRHELQATVKKIISLEEVIEQLHARIQSSIRMSFKEFSGMGIGAKEKVEIVVSFLALLELVKRGTVNVEQESHFSDILIETEAVSLPQY